MKAQNVAAHVAWFSLFLMTLGPLMYHAEPIYRDGEFVGYTSSAMYGYTLGASVALGYVRHEGGVTKEFIESGNFEIEVEGKRYPAKASLKPFYDPGNERVRR